MAVVAKTMEVPACLLRVGDTVVVDGWECVLHSVTRPMSELRRNYDLRLFFLDDPRDNPTPPAVMDSDMFEVVGMDEARLAMRVLAQ